MERRDFVGALLALFCGMALPRPQRRVIHATAAGILYMDDITWKPVRGRLDSRLVIAYDECTIYSGDGKTAQRFYRVSPEPGAFIYHAEALYGAA